MPKFNPKQFVKMPYTLLDNKTFEWFNNIDANSMKIVYIALQYYRSNGTNKIRISQEKIGEIIGLKKRQVCSQLNRLKEAGIIEIKTDEFNFYGWNTYKILVNEKFCAQIPFEIAFNKGLTASQLMAYCNLKRMTNIKKKDYICYADTKMLAEVFNCSIKQVSKIKKVLKERGLIDFEARDNKIILSYEKALYEIDKRKQHIEKTVKNKNIKEIDKDANYDIL